MPASRYRPYYPRDQAPTSEGDPGFLRVNAKASPELLQPAELAGSPVAVNLVWLLAQTTVKAKLRS